MSIAVEWATRRKLSNVWLSLPPSEGIPSSGVDGGGKSTSVSRPPVVDYQMCGSRCLPRKVSQVQGLAGEVTRRRSNGGGEGWASVLIYSDEDDLGRTAAGRPRGIKGTKREDAGLNREDRMADHMDDISDALKQSISALEIISDKQERGTDQDDGHILLKVVKYGTKEYYMVLRWFMRRKSSHQEGVEDTDEQLEGSDGVENNDSVCILRAAEDESLDIHLSVCKNMKNRKQDWIAVTWACFKEYRTNYDNITTNYLHNVSKPYRVVIKISFSRSLSHSTFHIVYRKYGGFRFCSILLQHLLTKSGTM